MNRENQKIRSWGPIPLWGIIGAAVILIPILAVTTVQDIRRQKAAGTRLLLEKGAALIRSFEAGTRIGVLDHPRGTFQFQRLLTETARLSDIHYLMVVDADGVIVAHSDPDAIGGDHGLGMDLARVLTADTPLFRVLASSDHPSTFEVYHRFSPAGPPPHRGRGRHMMMRRWFNPPREDQPQPPPDSQRETIIFVGLDMTDMARARAAGIRHSLVMAGLLLGAGIAGVLVLSMAQHIRATRARLSRAESFSDRLMTDMPMGLVALEPDGTVAVINPRARALLGIPATDIRAIQLPTPLAAVLESVTPDRPMVETDIEVNRSAADRIPLGVVATEWSDDQGSRLGAILLIKDLTEVRALQRAIARNQRLASVGTLAAGVAHEIRNPLSSIKGFATYFQERYKDVDSDAATAGLMVQETDRLNRVVGQLLELARPITVNRHTQPIAPVIDRAVALVRQQADQQGVTVTMGSTDMRESGRFDADHMTQALLNLLLNALDAMPDGGALTIDTDTAIPGRLCVSITDTGVGISAEDQAQIFDPFFTRKSNGTGLGLAIVHNIVEAHDGRIAIRSEPGQGTRITIDLPQTDTADTP